MINFALSNWKRAPLCERLTLLLSCEGVAFVPHKIVERAPAVGADTHFLLFRKAQQTKASRAKALPLSLVCIVLHIFVIRVRLLNFKMSGRQYYE